MYDFEYLNQQLHVSIRGDRVLEGLVPSLRLDDGTVIVPALDHTENEPGQDRFGPYTLHRFVYREEDRVILTLAFRAYSDTVVASTAVVSPRADLIGAQARGLAAFGGLQLHVEGLGDVAGSMANYLHLNWWSRPHFGADLTALPARTQSVVWRSGDRYHHLLCGVGDVLKTEIVGDETGLRILTAAYDGGYTNVDTVTFVLSSGDTPDDLAERNVAAGMHALGTPFQTREHKRYPEIFEYLGWCSWDAFYHEVNAEGVLAKAQELRDKGVPVRWFIVDDGWLSQTEGRLTAFAPDATKFPDGFAPLVVALKEEYGLGWVGAWHTLFGYWNGIHPESALAAAMAPALHTTHTGRVVPTDDVERAFGFWNAWHTYLRRAGIDFVKVDCQSEMFNFWAHESAIGTVAQAAHEALEASVGVHFDNAMINCMGMAMEDIWHRPISAVTRNSDDFFPKKQGSFTEHALQNAYNAYYHAPFMWLDWDMWWTRHEHAATHAVLRAISGGPVYVSDRVGETDPRQLWPLILSDGRLLRCDVPGVVTADGLLQDPSREGMPLKVWNRVGEAGIVAAVNVDLEQREVTGTVGPGDVPRLEADRCVIYEHFTQRAWVLNRDDRIPVTLGAHGAALYVLLPLSKPHTPIGLVDKYIAPAAIADWVATAEKTTVVLLDGGVFAWAAEDAPQTVLINGERVEPATVAAEHTGIRVFTVDCSHLQGSVWVEIS